MFLLVLGCYDGCVCSFSVLTILMCVLSVFLLSLHVLGVPCVYVGCVCVFSVLMYCMLLNVFS